jgi:peptidoglycan glycosyltransferase
MMVAVVTNGQANVGVTGIQVAGKTGTAETGVDGNSHAWFLAIAPVEKPTIAIAVIVENGGHGGSVAAPVAGQIIQAALGQ